MKPETTSSINSSQFVIEQEDMDKHIDIEGGGDFSEFQKQMIVAHNLHVVPNEVDIEYNIFKATVLSLAK